MKEISIAYIGGGSRGWAVNLMRDLALSGTLTGILKLHDIDQAAAEHNARLGREIFSHPEAKAPFATVAEPDLASALKGAHFVVLSIEPGPMEMRFADLEIPAQHGILQSVGDTTGPGGLLRALRCIPLYRHFARMIMEHCPNAWVINYTNPMAVCTATLAREAPTIKVFGCCHEVFGTQKTLAEQVADWFETEEPPREEIKLDIAGVNHFTWAVGAKWRGHDLMARLQDRIAEPGFFRDRTADARQAARDGRWFGHHWLIPCDFLRRFGALGAAGDRHLAEFVPWYLTSEEEIHRWGVVLTPYAFRLERSKQARLSPESIPVQPLKASGEEGVMQMEAILGLRSLVTNVNLPNRNQQLPGSSTRVAVETYAEFSQDRVRPISAAPLPAGAAEWVRRATSEQEMTLDAGFSGSLTLAFEVLLNHPLVRLPTDRAWDMFREMLEAAQPFVPKP